MVAQQCATAMAENAPVEIGNYRLLTTLGIGAFGKVKRECSSIRHAAELCWSSHELVLCARAD